MTSEDVLSEKVLLGKATTIKRFQYSPLGSELKKQTDIPKHQYKFFKDQMNIINNNREDGVKAEDGFKTEDFLRTSPSNVPGKFRNDVQGISHRGPSKHVFETICGQLLDVLRLFLFFFRNLFD